MDHTEVQELMAYCVELEGQVVEKKIDDTYSKCSIYKNMLEDILTSCKEYEENKILKQKYPNLYQNTNADALVKNLLDYIITMSYKNNLKFQNYE